jgi:hypothetical protein
MPTNTCTPLFDGGDDPITVRASAGVTGKRFGAISANIQSGPDITTAVLPTTWDGGNLQAATCGAGLRADGVFAYDQVSGGVLPFWQSGNIVPVTAGATITAGQEIEVGTAGKAIPLAAGKAVGKAYTSAASAADCYVELY